MSTDDRIEFLLRVPLFADAKLDPASLRELAEAFRPKTFAAGSALFREGDPATEMYVVRSGRIGIFKRAGGSRALLATLGAGDYFGELAVVDGGTRSADAEALEDVSLLALEDSVADALIERIPRLALAFLKATSRRLREASKTLASAAPHEREVRAPDVVRDRFPHPIAAVFHSMSVQVDPRPRVERMFDLLETVVRYVGSVAVSVYATLDRPSEPVDEMILRGLGKMTLGSWMFLLREVAQRMSPDAPICELQGFVFARPGRPSDAFKALDGLIVARNTLRHGAGGAMTDRELAALLDANLPAMTAVLGALGFLADHPLVWLERMDYTRGAFVYRYLRCVGANGDFASDTLTLKEPRETAQLYVLDRGAVLSMHPWMLLDACGVCHLREVFFLYDASATAIEYTEMLRGHHHLADAPIESLDALRREARTRLHKAEDV